MENELELLCGLIRRFEGCKLKAYYCPAGVLTCGWGSTGPDVTLSTVWTQDQADRRMLQDARRFLDVTKKLCPNLTGSRLAAIADFSYNLGLARLKNSTLRKRIVSEDYSKVPQELRKWVNGGGKPLQGLVLRREAEVKLFGETDEC